jgi:hypothetical protein
MIELHVLSQNAEHLYVQIDMLLRIIMLSNEAKVAYWLKADVRAPRAVRPLSGSKRTLRAQNRAAPSRPVTAAGDRDGQAAWMRVMGAVDELLSKARPKGAEAH